MNIGDIVDTIDDCLLDAFTQAAATYQDITGRPKDDLVKTCYGAGLVLSSFSAACSPPGFVKYINAPAALGYSTLLLANSYVGEKEILEWDIFKGFAVTASLSSAVLVPPSILKAVSQYNMGEMESMKKTLGLVALVSAFGSAAAGMYFERADVDPPPEDPIWTRAWEKLMEKYMPQRKLA